MVPPTRHGPCSDSAREGSKSAATAKTSEVWSAVGSGKTGRTLRRRPVFSVGQRNRARRRWGNIISSVQRGRSIELMRGGGVCQAGLACVNGVVNGRKSFSEHIFPSPPGGLRASGSSARRRMPHTGSKRLSSAKRLEPVLRRCYFITRFSQNLAKMPVRTASSLT